jgi:hypothetical protein
MTDFDEPMFDIVPNPNILVGYCAIVTDDLLVYAGPVRNCPEVAEGSEIFLHPKDVATINAWFKKHQH